MKTLVLYFLFFLLSTAFIIMMDLMMGKKLSMSLRNMINPFWLMTITEYLIMFVLLSITFIPPIVSFIKQRKQDKPSGKS
ncbi:MAG TPA: hypothetical protein VGE40_03760 [Bacilli bacterium]